MASGDPEGTLSMIEELNRYPHFTGPTKDCMGNRTARPLAREWVKAEAADRQDAFVLVRVPRGMVVIDFDVEVDPSTIALADLEGVDMGRVSTLLGYVHHFPTLQVATPSGGLHAWYRLPGDMTLPSLRSLYTPHARLSDEYDLSGDPSPRSVDILGFHKAVVVPPTEGYTVVQDVPMALAPHSIVEEVYALAYNLAYNSAAPLTF